MDEKFSNKTNGSNGYKIDKIVDFIDTYLPRYSKQEERRKITRLSEDLNKSGLDEVKLKELWGLTNELFEEALFIYKLKETTKYNLKKS